MSSAPFLADTPEPTNHRIDTRLLWAGLFFAVATYAKFPGLDLLVSARYFDLDLGFFRAKEPMVVALYQWTPILGRILFVVMLLHALLAPWLARALAALGQPSAAQRCRGPWRHLSTVFVCAALLGPGVAIEGVLKNTVGRPRPVQTVPFGGPEAYQGPFTPGDNPGSHRSFVSSHAATGFALMALGLTGNAAARRRWLLIGIAAGSAVGAGRIMQGGHFLSDIVFAFYAVWLSCELVIWLDGKRLQRRRPPPPRPRRPHAPPLPQPVHHTAPSAPSPDTPVMPPLSHLEPSESLEPLVSAMNTSSGTAPSPSRVSVDYELQDASGATCTAHAWARVPAPLSRSAKDATQARIAELLKARNAVLVAHYYVDGDLQDLALATGGCVSDSLEMARFGRDHAAQTLIVAGVKFMGESAKILSPGKTVLMPDLDATCSLDLGCPADDFAAFCDAHPDRQVVVYANTSAAVKARADWMVTSSCALAIVQHLKDKGQKILWAPDRHLGRYIEQETGADMLMWNGACIVHDEFKGVELDLLKKDHPNALVLVHPESPESVVAQADVVGSTSQLLQAVVGSNAPEFIVATDNGILHRMRQLAPGKLLIEAPTAGNSATCKSCAHCPWMAMNGLQGVLDCLEKGVGEITVDEATRLKAHGCIDRMLAFVAQNPAAIAKPARGFVPHIGSA